MIEARVKHMINVVQLRDDKLGIETNMKVMDAMFRGID